MVHSKSLTITTQLIICLTLLISCVNRNEPQIFETTVTYPADKPIPAEDSILPEVATPADSSEAAQAVQPTTESDIEADFQFDTVRIDINRDSALDYFYFERIENSLRLKCNLSQEDTFTIDEPYNDWSWVRDWGICRDTVVSHAYVIDGEVSHAVDTLIESPSVFFYNEERMGGILTIKNKRLGWIHQAD